jgi:hypothetical protein
MHALITHLAVGDPTFDFSGTTNLITLFAAALALAVLAVFGTGLGIAATIWGFPKLVGLFKKSAK